MPDGQGAKLIWSTGKESGLVKEFKRRSGAVVWCQRWGVVYRWAEYDEVK